jgi:P4 family phage/plasmid primase-like protien
VAEIGEIDKVSEGVLKSFTSGDRMLFEQKHKDPYSAVPTARLVLVTNNLPRFTDRSAGLWRRMCLMPFRVTISESEKIPGMDKPEWWIESGELPGIFNWSVAGLKRLRKQGRFTESQVCKKALDEFRVENNPARSFLLKHYREHVEGEVVTNAVYSKYATWCTNQGYKALASNTFGREIKRAFPRSERKRVTLFGDREWCYVGICEGGET